MEAALEHAREIVLSLEDGADVRAVRLHADVWKREPPREFVRTRDGRWELVFARPLEVERMEYMLEIEREDGTEVVADPTNPLRVPGPFGDKSALEFDGYATPAWVDDHEAPAGELRALRLRSRRLRAEVGGLLWSPPDSDPDELLPLLVVHDGPEYAEYSRLVRLLESASAELELPPLRAALLAPPLPRDDHYSASARYARALAVELLPALARTAPSPARREARVGMGASLGALSMLHAHRAHPETLGGLFLQSGSFFRLRSDRQEWGFSRFDRIARFVGTVLRTGQWPYPVPVVMTCGTGEENLANNRVVRDALARQGYHAVLHEHPDAHNWVSWRDTFDPPLVTLLQRLWG